MWWVVSEYLGKSIVEAWKTLIFSGFFFWSHEENGNSVISTPSIHISALFLPSLSLFGCLVADGWCWFVLREEYCWLVADGWFVLWEKYYWLVADKPSEQGILVLKNIWCLRNTCGAAHVDWWSVACWCDCRFQSSSLDRQRYQEPTVKIFVKTPILVLLCMIISGGLQYTTLAYSDPFFCLPWE
jgi:hypothetical protein